MGLIEAVYAAILHQGTKSNKFISCKKKVFACAKYEINYSDKGGTETLESLSSSVTDSSGDFPAEEGGVDLFT